MTVIVLNETPPYIRGILKRWFLEPKPNVFVGTVNKRTRQKTLQYVRRNAPCLGMLVIASDNSTQGFNIRTYGLTKRKKALYCGLCFIVEKWYDNSVSLQTAL